MENRRCWRRFRTAEGGGDARVSSLSVKNAVLHDLTADDDNEDAEDNDDILATSNFIHVKPFPSPLHLISSSTFQTLFLLRPHGSERPALGSALRTKVGFVRFFNWASFVGANFWVGPVIVGPFLLWFIKHEVAACIKTESVK